MKSLVSSIVGPVIVATGSLSCGSLVAEDAAKANSSGFSFRYDQSDAKENATRFYAGEIAPVLTETESPFDQS